MRADLSAMGLSLIRHWGLDEVESLALAAASPDFADVVGAASFDGVGASFGVDTLESLLAGPHAVRRELASNKSSAENGKTRKRVTDSPPIRQAFYNSLRRCVAKSTKFENSAFFFSVFHARRSFPQS